MEQENSQEQQIDGDSAQRPNIDDQQQQQQIGQDGQVYSDNAQQQQVALVPDQDKEDEGEEFEAIENEQVEDRDEPTNVYITALNDQGIDLNAQDDQGKSNARYSTQSVKFLLANSNIWIDYNFVALVAR